VRTRLRAVLGPLEPLVLFAAVAMLLLSASRLALVLWYHARLRDVPQAWMIMPLGVRLDSMAVAVALWAPAAIVLAWPPVADRLRTGLAAAACALVACVMTFMEASTPPFLAQYDTRPNRIFIDYLRYPQEIVPTVWSEQKVAVVVGLVVVIAVTVVTWRTMYAALSRAPRWPWWRRLVALPIVAGLLFLGARSSIGHRAANISTAAFSSDHFANELALNSTYAVGYAVEHGRKEVSPGRLYGSLDRYEAMNRVKRQMIVPDSAFTDPKIPLLHRQPPTRPRAEPYNLVVFLQESLGAEYVGTLGGHPLTPELDALAKEGLLLTNLYATGTRTVRGIEAVVCGFPPTPGDAMLKRGLAQTGFFTLAELLRRRGYATEFFYGGASNFDNMGGFFLNNGFDRVYDEPTFPTDAFRGTWGVSDEDLVRKANATFVAHGDRPFFALMLSTTNHPPFEYPPGRIQPSGPPDTLHNAIRFADYAIGELFRLAKREEYFRRTVFLVVADHDTRVYGADLVPISKFHIPGLIIAPGLEPRRWDVLASQIDLAPTLLDVMGLDVEHPMPGRDLLAVPDGTPGRAIMQYDMTNAYRVGDHVVVLQPDRPPHQFVYRDGHLEPEPLDPDLARDALAHVQVPNMLYHDRSYRLPEPTS
jgi:phosphoglycerol transferase MdoB-like AlkP superfamily enzyme